MTAPEPIRRPPRWSPANWPVRRRVLAIAVVPLLLASVFGGMRIWAGLTEAADLRQAAHHAELIPPVVAYLDALEHTLAGAAAGADPQAALAAYDARRAELADELDRADPVPDVRLAVTTLLDHGRDLADRAATDAIDLRRRVTAYAPLLLTAETAITGSVRGAAAEVRTQAEALARAVGARGQMTLQQLLVTRGGELAEPELRTALTTLAGTEPSTVTGMAAVLGGTSEQAHTLRSEMVRRMGLLSDPAVPPAGNPDLLGSQRITRNIAVDLIDELTPVIPAEVAAAADAQRTAAIRDGALVLAAIAAVLALVLVVGRSLAEPLRRLRDGALRVAHEDLARELEQVRRTGEPVAVTPLPVHTAEEIGQVAHAVDELHEQAVLLAGEQARLQLQQADMFETLSRRSRSLVDQQLALIDRLERDEEDPERLEHLFRLDHLAARIAPQRRQPAGARRRQGAPRAHPSGAGGRRHQRRRFGGGGLPAGGHHHGARQPRRRPGRRRPGASAGRAARQRAALLAAGGAGAGLGGAHRQRGAGRRGRRHRHRDDRGRSADGQQPAQVRWPGRPVHRPPHGAVRGRPTGRPAPSGGATAQHHHRRARIRHHRRGCTCRPSTSSPPGPNPPSPRRGSRRPRPPGHPDRSRPSHPRRRWPGGSRPRSGCCRSATRAPPASPPARHRPPTRRKPPTLPKPPTLRKLRRRPTPRRSSPPGTGPGSPGPPRTVPPAEPATPSTGPWSRSG